ncbi:MAG: nitroreductase family protein [Streptococcaceae bacterium]|jgi:nitroreductase|nr:nitroreductase family protein [Streptococcaceae bacterium]
MNSTIDLLKGHASIRKFDLEHKITDEEMQAMFDASRQASTWMNGEFYSIIHIKDPAKKEEVYNHSPEVMRFIKNNNELVVFVGDMHRTHLASQMHDREYHANGIEPLLMATVDASLAAQNFLVAAESLGYGGVMIGMIRDQAKEIAQVLELPERTIPLFAIAIGKPAQKMYVKPRLQHELVVHTDTYKAPTVEQLKEYDDIQTEFAGPRQTKTWTQKFASYFSRPQKTNSEELMKENGLL